MKKLLMICSFLFISVVSYAQFVTFTATVKDASGQSFSYGSYNFTYVRPANDGGATPNIAGVAVTPSYSGALDAAGFFSLSLEDLRLIVPTNGKWRLTVCPNASTFCSVNDIVKSQVTGGSTDFTSYLQTNIATITVSASSVISRVYKDSEVSGSAGSVWLDTTLGVLKYIDQTGAIRIVGSTPVGAVLLSPTLDQTVVQPSLGGLSTGTSLNVNVFEQVRYADQFQWSQTPGGSISIGANTITINAIRGIAAQSAYPGIIAGGTHYLLSHQIWIAGTGTPERVTLTSTDCTGASTGTCHISFVAANNHVAGYTVGTATAGFQEANVDCFGLFDGGAFTNVTTACVLKGSPYTLHGHYVFNGTWNMENIGNAQIELDCQGATLEDNVSGDAMILYGGGLLTGAGTNTAGPEQGLIHSCHFAEFPGIGRAANGTQVLIRDYGQGLAVNDNTINGADAHAGDFIDTLIWVTSDQAFSMNHNDVLNLGKCDSTWCGPAIYGDPTNNAAIGTITNNNFVNVSGYSTAIEWDSGNGLTIRDNIFQNWAKYPWRYSGGLTSPTDQGGNYYEGAGAIINPDFGVAGYAQTTGPQIGLSGTQVEYKPGANRGQNALGVHRFSNTGTNCYSYYIVGHDGIGHQTRPLFVGDACSDNVTTYQVLYLKFGATTYDVLRSGPALGDGTDAAPWGDVGTPNNWAVATGVTCSVNPCSFTENFTAPTGYNVLSESPGFTYCPSIPYWPVPLFIMGNCGTPTVYIGPQVNGLVNNTSQSALYYDGIYTSSIGGTGNITGMKIKYDSPLISGGHTTGALILNPDDAVGALTLKKGRVNFASYSQQGATSGPLPNMTNNLLVQTYDFEASRTLATAGHRPNLHAKDMGIGYDNDGSYYMTMCGEHQCTWYLNHLPDSGTSYKMRLLPTKLDLPTGSCFSVNSVCLTSGTGTVTSVATTGPITGGTFTTSGTIACATCTTSAAALTSNGVLTGAGLQAMQATTLSWSANTLTLGVTAGGSAVLNMPGGTSGAITITAPLVAGTTTNAIAFSNVISTPNGAVATPAYAVNGGNTGMYFAAGLIFVAPSNSIFMQANGTATTQEWTANETRLGSGGIFDISSNASPAVAVGDIGWSRQAAALAAWGNGAQGNETGLFRSGMPCRITAAITLSTAATTLCTWNLPALAKTWSWDCSGAYSITAGTTPAFGLGMNASQTPTSETGNGVISSVTAGTTIVDTNNQATATASGNQSIITGATVTTVTNAYWNSYGTVQASATAGTFAITGILTGTTPAGTVTVGSECTLN